MLTVKIWCLPGTLTEDQMTDLHNAIVAAVSSVPGAGINDEDDMLNLFPVDMMQYGLGREIKIEVLDTLYEMGCFGRRQLATAIGKAVKNIFKESNVYCKVRKPDPEDGAWSSKE